VIGIGAATVTTVVEFALHVLASSQPSVSNNLPPHHTPVSTPPFGTLLYSPSINPPYAVFSVAWSPNGKRIASGWRDKTVRIWNAATGIDIFPAPITGHTGTVFSVAWSPDGKNIASGSDDHTVKVWNASTGKNVLTYQGHSNRVSTVSWSPDGRYIASGSFDETAQVWWAT
jgi:WD40 repeat protein